MILQALNAQEESQRMLAVRKAYQRAVVTPTHHVEQLWRDYENFENSVSRQLVSLLFRVVFAVLICLSEGACVPMCMNESLPISISILKILFLFQLVIFGTGLSVCVCGWVFIYI